MSTSATGHATRLFWALAVGVLSIALVAGCSPAPAGGGSSAPELRIGWMAATSGSYAQYGRTMMEGADLVVEDINNAGGLDIGGTKRKLTLVKYDTASDPQQALAVVKRFVEQDKVDIVMGLSASSEAAAIESYWKQQTGKVLIATDTTFRGPLFQGDNAFRVSGAQVFLDRAGASFFKDKVKSVAILSDASHAGVMGTLDDTLKAFKDAGLRITTSETYPNDTTTDFYPLLSKLKNDPPDLIFARAVFQAPLLMAKQASELGLKSTFSTEGSSAPDAVLKVVPASVIEGMWVVSNVNATNLVDMKVKGAPEFVERFRKTYNEEPGLFSVNGADGVRILAEALKRSGSATDMKALQGALKQMPPPSTMVLPVKPWQNGSLFSSGEYNEINIQVAVSRFENGNVVLKQLQ